MNLEWLGAVLIGLALTCAPAQWIFYPAQLLRAFLWASMFALGTYILPFLRAASVIIGVISALPLLSTLMPMSVAEGDLNSPLGTTGALPFILFVRFFFRPGTAFNWPRIRSWEQEVVLRSTFPQSPLWPGAANGPTEHLLKRIWSLSKNMAQVEFKNSPALDGLPLRGTGILILHISALLLPPNLNHFRPELALLIASVALAVGVFQSLSNYPALRLTLISLLFLPTGALFLIREFFSETTSVWLPKSPTLTRFELIVVAVSVFTLSLATLRRTLIFTRWETPALDSVSVDRRYIFLRKIAEIGKWASTPRNLITLFVQTDLLIATLRITLTWL